MRRGEGDLECACVSTAFVPIVGARRVRAVPRERQPSLPPAVALKDGADAPHSKIRHPGT